MYRVRSHISTIEQLRAEVLSHLIAGMFGQEKPYTAYNRSSLKSKKTNGNLYYRNISNECLYDKKLRINKSKLEKRKKLTQRSDFLDNSKITFESNYCFDGKRYNVYRTKEGLCIPILNKSLEILHHSEDKWKRVCMVRFDLHQKGLTTANSSHVSQFIKNLNRRLERHYKHMPFYIWAREVGAKEGGQHYHFALFLNGNKCNHTHHIKNVAEEIWENINDKHHFYLPKNSYRFIDSQEVMNDAVFRLSYLSKIDTKIENPLHKNNYSSSRIKKK